MELIRAWVLTVTVSALVVAAAEALMPEGAVKKVGKLTGGLILVLGILQPLMSMDYQALYDQAATLPAGGLSRESLTEAAADPMKGIIEAELSAYIVDKGAELGLSCTAQVECAAGEEGLPTPRQVTVSGPFTQSQKERLMEYITQDLGIPRELQFYRNEATP